MDISEIWEDLSQRPIVLIKFDLVDGLANVFNVQGNKDGFFISDVCVHFFHILIMVFILEKYP
jgi:hypothetical protein